MLYISRRFGLIWSENHPNRGLDFLHNKLNQSEPKPMVWFGLVWFFPPLMVPTSYPLRQLLQKPKSSKRLIKWSIELGQYEISYKPHTTIKAQVVVDFFCLNSLVQKERRSPSRMLAMKRAIRNQHHYGLYMWMDHPMKRMHSRIHPNHARTWPRQIGVCT